MKRRAFLTTLGIGAVAAGGAAVAETFSKPPRPSGSADLERWKRALAGARLYAITRLRTYRAAGRFPRNHRIFGHTPTFIDPSGTPCAVGYLMQRSGGERLARQIADTDNHVYIDRIKDGPALDWIVFSGLTQQECARIQPSYNWEHRPKPEPELEQVARLQLHFETVVAELLDTTDVSLTEAVRVIEPRIARGASIDRVAR